MNVVWSLTAVFEEMENLFLLEILDLKVLDIWDITSTYVVQRVGKDETW